MLANRNEELMIEMKNLKERILEEANSKEEMREKLREIEISKDEVI